MKDKPTQPQDDIGQRAAQEFAECIVDTVRESMLVLTPDLCVKSANLSFYRTFQVEPSATIGRLIFELGNGQWNIPSLRTLLGETLPRKKSFEDFRVEHHFEGIGHHVMMLNARRLDDQKMILLAIEDVTEKEKALQELLRLKETLEQRVKKRSQQVRQLASALVRAEQDERSRIAQILHDDLQQYLYRVRIKSRLVRRAAVEGNLDQLSRELEDEDRSLERALELTHQLTVDLIPPTMKSDDLAQAIHWVAEQMEAMHGLKVEVATQGDFRIPDHSARELLYQVVRELLFNVVKHAGVDCAAVRLTHQNGEGSICVSDHGRGFDPEDVQRSATKRSAFGLATVGERLGAFGWRLKAVSKPSQGTRITLTMPADVFTRSRQEPNQG